MAEQQQDTQNTKRPGFAELLNISSNPLHFTSLGFGTGLFPKAPGTAGTLVGIPFFLLLYSLLWWQYLAVVVLMFIVGVWLCGYTSRALNVHDHPAIVWDEVVGYLVTMFLAPPGWQWLLLGFVLFRIFDIFKPWPCNWLDKNMHGGFGIMIDDVVAGIYALLLMQALGVLV